MINRGGSEQPLSWGEKFVESYPYVQIPMATLFFAVALIIPLISDIPVMKTITVAVILTGLCECVIQILNYSLVNLNIDKKAVHNQPDPNWVKKIIKNSHLVIPFLWILAYVTASVVTLFSDMSLLNSLTIATVICGFHANILAFLMKVRQMQLIASIALLGSIMLLYV